MYNFKRPLFLFLILSILFVFGGCKDNQLVYKAEAVSGLIDLTRMTDNEIVRLDGQWEFYPDQLLTPQQLKESVIKSENFINIPGSWNNYEVDGDKFTGNGFATFRLVFIADTDKRLGLKLPRIFTAYKLWINGETAASAGITGKDRKSMKPQYLPQIVFFDPQKGENEIVVEVSNYYHRSGGILESIEIGCEKQIIGSRIRNIGYALFLFGSLTIIGAYHLALYFFRKKNRAPLFFGLFCLFVAARTMMVGERFFLCLFPDFSWEIAHKIQTLTFYLGVPVIVLFFLSFFPDWFSRKICLLIQAIGLAFSLLVLITPARIFTVVNPAYQIFAFAVIIYLAFVFIKMLINKVKGTALIFSGALALFITSLNDMIFLSIWMNDDSSSILRTIAGSGSLSSFGQLIFVFAVSLQLSRMFADMLEKEETLTSELREINLNLDRLVQKRTRALEESKKQIECQKNELEITNRSLQLMTLKDPLTGLWNRRHFDSAAYDEWNRCLRYQRPLSLIIIDIDHFKEYNDANGHIAGDKCLIKISETIMNSCRRAGDLTVRYGGEEFVVIMPEIGEKDARNRAYYIQKSIEALEIPHDNSPVNSFVTVSLGISTIIPSAKDSLDDLFYSADKALYQAKAAGRNCAKYINCK